MKCSINSASSLSCKNSINFGRNRKLQGESMDAVVMAGGIPNPEDPLYTFLKGDAKALVDVAGKPMIQWVLDALGGAKRVDNVILVGLSPKNQLNCRKPLHFISNQG